jgi:uncharacterized protein (DUF305 family)
MHCSIFKSAVLVTFAALTVAAVPASGTVARSPASPDLQFVDRMIARLTRELELARTADATAQLPALKAFAHALITEREDQLNDLAEIRSRLTASGNSIPDTRTAEPPAGPTATAAQADSGSDRGMIDEFIRRHREAIQLARAQAASGKDAELNAFARRLTYSVSANLPQLQQMRETIPDTSGRK